MDRPVEEPFAAFCFFASDDIDEATFAEDEEAFAEDEVPFRDEGEDRDRVWLALSTLERWGTSRCLSARDENTPIREITTNTMTTHISTIINFKWFSLLIRLGV